MKSTSRSSFSYFTLSALGAFTFAGCGGGSPADPALAQERLGHLEATLQATQSAADGVGNSQVMGALLNEEPSLRAGESDDLSAEVSDFLRGQLLTEANYEGGGKYSLKLLCDGDPQCAEMLDQLKIHLQVEELGDTGLHVGLRIDSHEPLWLSLDPTWVRVGLDLGETYDAAKYLVSRVAPGQNLPIGDSWKGQVELGLSASGQQAEMTLSVPEAIDVNLDGAIRWQQEARSPMLHVQLDGAAEAMGVALDLGKTELSFPYSIGFDEQTMEFVTAGFTATTRLQSGDTSMTVENISIGDEATELRLGGQSLFSLALNPESGGSFALTVDATNPDTPSIQLSPEFHAVMEFALAPLAEAGEDIDAFFLSNNLDIRFAGDAPSMELFDSHAMITSGELVISSSSADLRQSFAEGTCFAGTETFSDHPFEQLEAISCGLSSAQ